MTWGKGMSYPRLPEVRGGTSGALGCGGRCERSGSAAWLGTRGPGWSPPPKELASAPEASRELGVVSRGPHKSRGPMGQNDYFLGALKEIRSLVKSDGMQDRLLMGRNRLSEFIMYLNMLLLNQQIQRQWPRWDGARRCHRGKIRPSITIVLLAESCLILRLLKSECRLSISWMP